MSTNIPNSFYSIGLAEAYQAHNKAHEEAVRNAPPGTTTTVTRAIVGERVGTASTESGDAKPEADKGAKVAGDQLVLGNADSVDLQRFLSSLGSQGITHDIQHVPAKPVCNKPVGLCNKAPAPVQQPQLDINDLITLLLANQQRPVVPIVDKALQADPNLLGLLANLQQRPTPVVAPAPQQNDNTALLALIAMLAKQQQAPTQPSQVVSQPVINQSPAAAPASGPIIIMDRGEAQQPPSNDALMAVLLDYLLNRDTAAQPDATPFVAQGVPEPSEPKVAKHDEASCPHTAQLMQALAALQQQQREARIRFKAPTSMMDTFLNGGYANNINTMIAQLTGGSESHTEIRTAAAPLQLDSLPPEILAQIPPGAQNLRLVQDADGTLRLIGESLASEPSVPATQIASAEVPEDSVPAETAAPAAEASESAAAATEASDTAAA